MGPVFRTGQSGQHCRSASSPPGVFSHEELQNVNSPMHVSGSLAEVSSSWLYWGLFPWITQGHAGPISLTFYVAGRDLFYFLFASNQDCI